MDDEQDNEQSQGHLSLYEVPRTVAELRPPPQSSLITEAQALQRANWDLVHRYTSAIAGTMPPMHGSRDADEWALTFQLQDYARKNGYMLLAEANAAQLKRAFRWAFKRNTGHSIGSLIRQSIDMKKLGYQLHVEPDESDEE